MRESLFQQISLHEVLEKRLKAVVIQVEKLPKDSFSQPNLDERLNEIVLSQLIAVPELGAPSGGERRHEERQANDGWGGTQTVKVGILDVTVPFTGDAIVFKFYTSHSPGVSADVRIEGNKLIVTIPDGDNVQAQVDQFINSANANLNRIRAEIGDLHDRLTRAAQQTALRRQTEIAKEKERDSRLSFPVRDAP
jgi:hypothetical protein